MYQNNKKKIYSSLILFLDFLNNIHLVHRNNLYMAQLYLCFQF